MDNLNDQKAQNQQPVDAGTAELPENELEKAAGGAMFHRPGALPDVNPVI